MKLFPPISFILSLLTLQANEFPLVQPISVEKSSIQNARIQKEEPIAKKNIQKTSQEKSLANAMQTTLLKIEFLANSASIQENSMQELEEFANYLIKNKSYQVVIYGYTDSTGSKTKNLILSQKRANVVIRVFEDLGVSSTRLTAIGIGEKNPIADNTTAKGRATNRRIEALVIE